MAFGESVGAETFELLEGALRKFLVIAVVDHSADQLVPELVHAPRELESRHGAAQLVRLGRGKSCRDHCHLHGLFLKQGHTQGLAENLFKLGLREYDRLLAFAPAQVRMDHVALDGTGPDNRDFDHKVIETFRGHARQHRHLGAAFDLEDPDRVRPADHLIRRRVFGRDTGKIEIDALAAAQEIKSTAHAAQHAEAQHIDLHEFQRVDIVLVPFDDLTVVHGRRLDGHQFVQPIERQHEAARVLREMPRRADQFSRKVERHTQAPVV